MDREKMKKSELKANTEFSIFSIDQEYWKRRVPVLHELAEWQMKTVDNALNFIRWYIDDTDEDCPFSAVDLTKIADDLVELAYKKTDIDLSMHREDYRALFRVANYTVLGGIVVAELVKLLDYTAKHLRYVAEDAAIDQSHNSQI